MQSPSTQIGNCRGSAFRCDEGGWVDIDAIINDRNNDIFPPTTSKAKRYMGIMEVIKWQESGHRKSRFQVLAARFPSIMNPNDMKAAKEELSYLGLGRDDIERVFNRCDGWFRPWCSCSFANPNGFDLIERDHVKDHECPVERDSSSVSREGHTGNVDDRKWISSPQIS